MQADEKIYFRETLGVKCTSIEIAHSYLDGRVDKKELFSINGKKITFADIFVQDDLVRGIILAQGELKELFPERHKFDDFFERYELFKKIVLLGDDSLAPLLIKLDAQKEQISKLQKEQQTGRIQLSCWKKNNEDLVAACKKAFQELQIFGTVIEAQKRNLDPQTDLFIRYSDILSITKHLTEKLCKNLQNNIVSATVSDISVDRKTIEHANMIDDFREKTEGVLAKRKNELDALVLSMMQEINTFREDTNRKIKADLDALEVHKKSEYQAIADAKAQLNREMNKREKELKQKQSDCKKHIEMLKKEAKDAITVSTDNLITLMSTAGEFEEKIRSDAKIIFSKLNTCKRWYVYPHIPEAVLYTSIKECGFKDFAPQSVLAIFDCSLFKNCSAGILVSTHAFYLFNGKTKKKYQLHRDSKIMTELKISWKIFWIIVGIASIASIASIVSFFSFPLKISITLLITCLVLQIAFFAYFRPRDIIVKYQGQTVITFPGRIPGRNAEEFEKFCSSVNQLCSSCTLTKYQITQIDKIMLK